MRRRSLLDTIAWESAMLGSEPTTERERAVVNLNLIARSFIREAAGCATRVGAIMRAWIFMETRAPCNFFRGNGLRDVARPSGWPIGAARDASRFTLSVPALAELNYPRARTREAQNGETGEQRTRTSLFLLSFMQEQRRIDFSLKQLPQLYCDRGLSLIFPFFLYI